MSPQKIERRSSVLLMGLYRTWFFDRETQRDINDVVSLLGLRRGIEPEVLDYLTSNGWLAVVRENATCSLILTAEGIGRGEELVDAGFGTANA